MFTTLETSGKEVVKDRELYGNTGKVAGVSTLKDFLKGSSNG